MTVSKNIKDIREEYLLHTLDIQDLHADPILQFSKWFDQALQAELKEVNAMAVSTVNPDGRPSLRYVLLKELLEGKFIFFTNYQSRKGKELEENAQIAALFYWKELERQIRIEGKAIKMNVEYSEHYFITRPLENQAGAIVSPQSSIISNRNWLEDKLVALLSHPDQIVMPKHWGAYAIIPDYFEFWQGRANRLHDRFCYTLETDGWTINRLAP